MQAIVGHSFNQSSSGQPISLCLYKASRLARWPPKRQKSDERGWSNEVIRELRSESDEFRPPKVRQQFRTSSGLPRVRHPAASSGVRRVPASQGPAASSGVRRVPASQSPAASSGVPSSGLPRVRQRRVKVRQVPESDEPPKVRPPKSPSDEFRPPRSPAASSGIHEFRHTTNLPRVRQRVRHPTNLARIWNSTSDATVTQIRTQILSGDDTAFSGLSHHPAVSCNVDPGGRPVTGPSLTLSQERSLAPSPTQELLIDVLAVAVKDLNLRPGNKNSAWTQN